jgi:two-component system response regulator YesN
MRQRPAEQPGIQQVMSWETFSSLSRVYGAECRYELKITDARGCLLPHPGVPAAMARVEAEADDTGGQARRRHLMEESLRWGEPVICPWTEESVAWAVPILLNHAPAGALLVEDAPLFADDAREEDFQGEQIRRAAWRLLELAEAFNLTNSALMRERREKLHAERERAEAIHAFKELPPFNLREFTLHLEPTLLSAVRAGDRHAARGILNQMLVGIYTCGGDNLNRLKSLVLELAVSLSRAAVEAGADDKRILGVGYHWLADLGTIQDEEDLSDWVKHTLESLMDAIHQYPADTPDAWLNKTVSLVRDHLAEPLGRDEVAAAVGISPAHFSRLLKKKTGRGFRELQTHYRVEQARTYLIASKLSLAEIAAETGFADQSHFSKVFRKTTGQSPTDYRRTHGKKRPG